MAQQPKRPTLTSPRLVFRFPKLTEPDTKFKDEGEYSVVGRAQADDPAIKKLIATCDKAAEESLAEAKANAKTPAEARKWETKYLPYKMVEDDETGEPTGEVDFKFTMKASGVSKKTGKPWTRKPSVFNAKGVPVNGEINIGGGTIGKVSFQIIPYAPTTTVGASVKMALEGVQIIDLKSYGEKSAKDHGFGEEEGGWSGDDEAQDDDDNGSAGGSSEEHSSGDF